MENTLPSADPAIQSSITDYWNFRSASYDRDGHDVREARERDAWIADLKTLLPAPPADVLDIGAGTGFLSLLLAGMGYQVAGVDPAEQMLARARQKSTTLPNPPVFQVGDGHAPPFPPQSFDIVTNRHVLWTLRDPATAFAAWREVLRPGGRVVALDSHWFQAEQEDTAANERAPYTDAWARHFKELEGAGMPLLRIQSMEPVADLFRSIGFTDVQVTRLHAVERVDAELALETDRRPMPRYAIVAIRPV